MLYIVSIGMFVIGVLIQCNKNINRKLKTFLIIAISIGLVISIANISKTKNDSKQTTFVSSARPVSTQPTRYMLVSSEALNVRTGPSVSYDVVGQLIKNTRVQVLYSSDQWWNIRYGDVEGYVNSAYLVNEKAASVSKTNVSPPRLSFASVCILILILLFIIGCTSDGHDYFSKNESSISYNSSSAPLPQRSESRICSHTGNLQARIVTEGHRSSVYDPAGTYHGYYDSRTNYTYNHAGNVVAQGNVLATLVKLRF